MQFLLDRHEWWIAIHSFDWSIDADDGSIIRTKIYIVHTCKIIIPYKNIGKFCSCQPTYFL